MKYLFLFTLSLFLFSCSGDYSPKPFGYFRIELEEPVYNECTDSFSLFSFNIQQNSAIEILPDRTKEVWFNIVYPALDAKIYCSYLPIQSPGDLVKISEDSRKFVYKHVIKADNITEQPYFDPQNKVYALIYDIDGNVATPIQFVITDSIHHFFKGSLLYVNSVPNQDSTALVTEYIRKDIKEMISSFRWKRE